MGIGVIGGIAGARFGGKARAICDLRGMRVGVGGHAKVLHRQDPTTKYEMQGCGPVEIWGSGKSDDKLGWIR